MSKINFLFAIGNKEGHEKYGYGNFPHTQRDHHISVIKLNNRLQLSELIGTITNPDDWITKHTIKLVINSKINLITTNLDNRLFIYKK